MKLSALLALCCLGLAPARAADSSYADALVAQAREKNLAHDTYWLKLGHYRPRLFGGHISEQDARAFFLAPRGKTNPAAELEATLRAFFQDPPADPEKMQAQCRFPARYAWLKERLGFDPARLPEQPCERFQEWRARIGGQSLTYVFAASYMNNPASMYGHTFLRVDRDAAGDALNATSVNFAADTPQRNGIIFAVRGLIGLYPGRFATSPYYIQVQKYNNIESRDLWEYQLSLSSAQVERVTRHLWEMGSADFRYFFLTENCSYQLLPLLETAEPSLQLADKLYWRVIPSDTVRVVLNEPGLVRSAKLRPSTVRVMLARRALLSPEERSAAARLAQGRHAPPLEILEKFSPERQALVLDAAYDYFRYRQNYARYQTPAADAYERGLLLRRGQLGIRAQEQDALPLAPEARPEAGHGTGRIGLGLGGDVTELSLRGALHDLTADPTGYVPDTRLEMIHLILRYNADRRRLYMERFTAVDIVSLAPLDPWIRKPSWQVFMGFKPAEDIGRPPEKALHFDLLYGHGLAVGTRVHRRETWYAMPWGDLGVGGIFRQSFRAGLGGATGLTAELTSRWRLHGEASLTRYMLGDVRWTPRLSLAQGYTLGKRWEARAELNREGPAKEAMFSMNFYL